MWHYNEVYLSLQSKGLTTLHLVQRVAVGHTSVAILMTYNSK